MHDYDDDDLLPAIISQGDRLVNSPLPPCSQQIWNTLRQQIVQESGLRDSPPPPLHDSTRMYSMLKIYEQNLVDDKKQEKIRIKQQQEQEQYQLTRYNDFSLGRVSFGALYDDERYEDEISAYRERQFDQECSYNGAPSRMQNGMEIEYDKTYDENDRKENQEKISKRENMPNIDVKYRWDNSVDIRMCISLLWFDQCCFNRTRILMIVFVVITHHETWVIVWRIQDQN